MSHSFNLHSTALKDLRAAKSEWSRRLFAAPRVSAFSAFAASTPTPDQNVVGVGIGEQIAGDQPTGVMAVKFFVRVKVPPRELAKKQMLPKSIDGMPVDVEQTGLFRRFAKKVAAKKAKPAEAAMPNPKTRFRPAQPGCSCGYEDPAHAVMMAGTFGALVRDAAGTHILSNNHVLADEGRLAAGAAIYQPGLLDGGKVPGDKIATLTRFIPFKSGANVVDAAIARLDAAAIASRDVLHIGAPGPVKKAAIDMLVHKFGRTTSYTVGRITSIDTDVTVSYDTGNFVFNDQIIIVSTTAGKPFSAGGDSGSLILERGANSSVGLLFAGSTTHTIANHLGDVLKALKVTMA